MTTLNDEETEVYGTMTDCLCPKCRRRHKRKMRWIGRGKPRKFCDICLGVIQEIDSGCGAELNNWAAVRRTVFAGAT